MNQARELQQLFKVSVRVLSSLVAGMAIVTLGSGMSWAQPRSGDLPKVEAGSSTSSHSKPASSSSGSLAATQNSAATSSASSRFFCQVWGGQYTVMYRPESRPNEVFPWAVPKDLGGGWFAEKRCGEISRRLEEYRPDGLQDLTTSTQNGYSIVCATTQSNPACRIVFTVPPGQDPIATRDSVFQNLTVADSGTMTQGVNTFAGRGGGTVNFNDDLVNLGLSILGGGSTWASRSGNETAINLRPYLDPADGGTGAEMINGIRVRKALRLNPEKFR